MAPKSVTFQRHDHLVSVIFGDLLSHSYNITLSMFLYLVSICYFVSLANLSVCFIHTVYECISKQSSFVE